MNIFLSWSGEHSHDIALAFSEWLPQVINAARPWLSSEDIEKGTRWFSEIGQSLSATDFGILCLTSTNLNAPWLLFEAGALSKSLDQSRVSPLLIDISNADLSGPLAQFNTTSLSKPEIFKLIKTINSRLPDDRKRTEGDLTKAFGVWWPLLDQEISKAKTNSMRFVSSASAPKKKRNAEDVIDEILELSRVTAQQIQQIKTTVSNSQGTLLTVGELAKMVGVPVTTLLQQFNAVGIFKSDSTDIVSGTERSTLLGYLKGMHQTNDDRPKLILKKKDNPK